MRRVCQDVDKVVPKTDMRRVYLDWYNGNGRCKGVGPYEVRNEMNLDVFANCGSCQGRTFVERNQKYCDLIRLK